MSKSASTLTPVLALLGAMLLWGSSFVATKAAYGTFHPIALVAARMAVASVVMLVLVRRLRGVRYQAGDWRWLLLMGVSEPCLYFVFEAFALKYTTASQAGMITAILPLLVSVAAVRVLGETLSLRRVTGLVVAIAGVVWLTLAGRPEPDAPNPTLGNLLEFVAMLCATGYMISVRRLSDRYTAWSLTALQSFCGAVFFLPMLALPGVDLPARMDLPALAAVAYLGMAVTLGACGLYNFGAGRLPASVASSYVNLIPVFTVGMGWLFLGETFNTNQMAASAVVFAGVFMTRSGASSGPTSPPRRARQ